MENTTHETRPNGSAATTTEIGFVRRELARLATYMTSQWRLPVGYTNEFADLCAQWSAFESDGALRDPSDPATETRIAYFVDAVAQLADAIHRELTMTRQIEPADRAIDSATRAQNADIDRAADFCRALRFLDGAQFLAVDTQVAAINGLLRIRFADPTRPRLIREAERLHWDVWRAAWYQHLKERDAFSELRMREQQWFEDTLEIFVAMARGTAGREPSLTIERCVDAFRRGHLLGGLYLEADMVETPFMRELGAFLGRVISRGLVREERAAANEVT